MKKIFYFLNGKIVEKNKALISVDDLGLLRGYGVFDYLRTYKRIPFHLEDHLNRFFHSAVSLNLRIPLSKNQIRKAIFELIEENKSLKEMAFRMVLTGGETTNARTSRKPTFFILVNPPHDYPPLVYVKGMALATADYEREFPGTKTINYLFAATKWNAPKSKAGEILYVKNGKVLEASTSNFFMVKNKTLFTPQEGVLGGITRKLVIKLAKENKIKIVEKDIFLKDALKADECFITATDKEITPVIKINGHVIASGQPGEQTKKLLASYRKLIAK